MTNKLFVGSLAYSVTDTQLQQHFLQVGNVLSAKVITDRTTGQSKGFGFVEMETPEAAQQAVSQLNGTALEGRNIIVSEARPQEDRKRNDFHRGGNDFGGGRRNDNFSGGGKRNNRW